MRLSVGAIAGLTHKTMIPFVIRMDNNKGLTDIMKQLKTSENPIGGNE